MLTVTQVEVDGLLLDPTTISYYSDVTLSLGHTLLCNMDYAKV